MTQPSLFDTSPPPKPKPQPPLVKQLAKIAISELTHAGVYLKPTAVVELEDKIGDRFRKILAEAGFNQKGTRSRARGEDRKRLSDQCRLMLQLLRDRGETGVTNTELSEIAIKYTGRISEIRGTGHNIETVRVDGGLFRYILHE